LVITLTIPFFDSIDEPDFSLLRQFDYLGLALLAVSLGSLEYVLEEGYRWNWMDDDTIRNFTWLSVVTGILFVWRSVAYSSPIVDLRALKSRTFAVACFFIFITGFGLFGGVYVLPLFLARVAGYDARQIGEAVFVAGLSQVMIAPLVAKLSQKMDPRVMLVVGFFFFAVGLWMNAFVTSQWQGGDFFWPQIIRGFALLLCIVPATNLALGALSPAQLKMSSALFNTMRNLGGAIGIACINTWINDRTNKHWNDLADHLTTANPRAQTWLAQVVHQIGSSGVDPALTARRSLAILAGKVRQQAVTMAFADTFYMMALLFFGALIFVPLLRRPAPVSAAAQETAH
jgi:DHA2 family multidrug resistance protein